jgi:hypothetical protein
MRHEGTLRQQLLKWGKPEDVDLFGVLKSEHRPAGDGFPGLPPGK